MDRLAGFALRSSCLLVALSLGCDPKGDAAVRVVVTASSAVTGIAKLHVRATANGVVGSEVDLTERLASTIPPDYEFGIIVPARHAGDFVVTVAALNASGAVLAQRTAAQTVAAGELVTIPVNLSASGDDLGDGGTGDLSKTGDLVAPACVTSATCPSAEPVCGATGFCRACEGSNDDPVCVSRGQTRCLTAGPNLGQCGECNPQMPIEQNTDCGSAVKPVCSTQGTCAGCTAHDECTSGACNRTSGACYAASVVAYVDRDGACVDTVHDSVPPLEPYCEISAAVAVSGKEIIRVAGSATPYMAVTIADAPTSHFIIGPGKDATPSARIFAGAPNPCVDLAASSGATTSTLLTLEGVVLGGTDATRTGVGLNCVNLSSTQSRGVTLKDVRVAYGTKGITSADCEVTVSDSVITLHSSTGIDLLDGSVQIFTSEISGNGASGVSASTGLLFVGDSSIHDNGTTGLDATGENVTIQSSIVSDNVGIGIKVDGGELRVTRSIVHGSGESGMFVSTAAYAIDSSLVAGNVGEGIVFDDTAPSGTSRLWFVTVVRNGGPGTASGIACGALAAGTRPIDHSIVALNGRTSSGPTQFAGACTFTNVATEPAESSAQSGLTKTLPGFIDTVGGGATAQQLRDGFRLASTDTVAKDRVDPAAGLPALDYFGTTRPQGAKLDIGFHEAAP